MPDLKQQVKGILTRHVGRHHAITARELAGITAQPERRVRLIIRELISGGLPIMSSTEGPAGYFLPCNWHEVTECTASLKGRLIEDAKRIRDIKHAAEAYLAPARQERLL